MSNRAIDAFWEWWATARQPFAESIRSRSLDPKWIEAMSAHVAAIDPNLDWELGKGLSSEHHLCLSAKGDPVGRVLTERWRSRGPAPDATWEYHPARQASPPGMSLDIDGHRVPLEELTFAITANETREVLDVSAWHAVFAAISDPRLRERITFIALDQALGEDQVERFVGRVAVADAPQANAVDLQGLRTAVSELAAKATRDRWAVLRGSSPTGPVFVMANLAAKRIDYLERDVHAKVTLPLEAPTDEGLTTQAEADVLNDLEDELVEALGEAALFLGRLTTDGRRELHFRVQEGGPSASLLAEWSERQTRYRPVVELTLDPRWQQTPW